MPKHSHYDCQQCGAQAPRWLGRCPDCGAWGSLIEVRPSESPRDTPTLPAPAADAVLLRDVPGTADRRLATGIGELDRVLGGGLVPGGVVLIGGDPGVGKSTLLLQAAAALAAQNHSILYVSGEESLAQVSERGKRLGLDPPGLYLAAETALESVLAHIDRVKPAMAIVDSIQTVWSKALEAGPGSLSQVREVAGRLLEVAKRSETGIWLIGHVTKDGSLAGPRALEHLVDTVIYFEGDRQQAHRILRATKNRFGPTDEIGVFEMRSGGLVPVENPSAAFLAERPPQATGCLVVATMEGTRPILLELQALVCPTGAAMPRRVANGLDNQRVAMLLAVLEKRLHLRLATADVFLNVVGGLGIREPAADLGVLAAVLSSAREIPVEPTWAFFGEVGLGGEVRGVPQADKRLNELARLGFTKAIVPRAGLDHLPSRPAIETVGLAHVGGLAALFGHTRRGETV